ncbi:MAG: hypothetical protein RRY34_09860, partial [Victivallaceae bacterium]
DKVEIEYFFRADCSECQEIEALVFPELEDKMSGNFFITKYDLAEEENFLKLLQYLKIMQNDSNEKMYLFLNRKNMLAGKKDISENIIPLTEKLYSEAKHSLDTTEESAKNSSEEVQLFWNNLSVGSFIMAGLIDGINPCVFTTMIFFISILVMGNASKLKILSVGVTYIISNYLTYLLMGIGAFKLLQNLRGIELFRHIINIIFVFLMLLVAIISFYDFWQFYRSNKGEKVILRLSPKLKQRINTLFRNHLNGSFLLPSVFVLGFVVTVLEGACTGQVYLPAVTFLLQQDGYFTHWLFWLLLYNLMFVLPLIGLFTIVLCGIPLMNIVKRTRQQLLCGKLCIGVIMIFFAVIILIQEKYL